MRQKPLVAEESGRVSERRRRRVRRIKKQLTWNAMSNAKNNNNKINGPNPSIEIQRLKTSHLTSRIFDPDTVSPLRVHFVSDWFLFRILRFGVCAWSCQSVSVQWINFRMALASIIWLIIIWYVTHVHPNLCFARSHSDAYAVASPISIKISFANCTRRCDQTESATTTTKRETYFSSVFFLFSYIFHPTNITNQEDAYT